MEKFNINSAAYSRGVRSIANCAFQPKDTKEKFVSKRNLGNSNKIKVSILSDKIVKALFESKEYAYNIFHGKKGDTDYFLGTFDVGSVTGPNYIALEMKSDTIVNAMGTNAYSHNLYTIMACILSFKRDKEFVKYYNELDLSQGYIDTNQEQPLFILNDVIYWFTKKLFDGKPFLDKKDNEIKVQNFIEETAEIVNENITSCLSDNIAITNAALKIGIDKDIPLYHVPEIKMPLSLKERLKVVKSDSLKKKYFRYQTVDDLKKANFPDDLIIRWKSGQEAFDKNAKNLSLDSFSLVKSLQRQSVVCLTGEAGGGKTTIAQTIAGCLGLPLITINGNADTDYASMILDYAAKDGETYAVLKPALLAYIHGGVVVIDEITRIKGEMSTALNAMLDKRDFYDAPNGVQYKKSQDFKVICTMNQGVGYTTEELDTSLIDRFNKVMFVPDPEKDLAVSIISDATGYKNRNTIEKMWDIKTLIDSKAREIEAISRTSLRGVIDWVNEAGITGELVESAISTILGKLMLKDEFISSNDRDYLLNECDNELITFSLESIIDSLEDIEILDEDFA